MKSNKWGEWGLKKKGKTRSMRKNQNQKFRFESPVESPVSVEGKSPCGQVDLLLRDRLLTLKIEDAHHGH